MDRRRMPSKQTGERYRKRRDRIIGLCSRPAGATIREMSEDTGYAECTIRATARKMLADSLLSSIKVLRGRGAWTAVYYTGNNGEAVKEARLAGETAYVKVARSDDDQIKEDIRRLVPELMALTGISLKDIANLFGCSKPTMRGLLDRSKGDV